MEAVLCEEFALEGSDGTCYVGIASSSQVLAEAITCDTVLPVIREYTTADLSVFTYNVADDQVAATSDRC